MSDTFKYAAMEPGRWTTDEPTPHLRWVVPQLQQAWAIKTYVGNSCTGVHLEWRDVPIVEVKDGE